MSTAQSLNPHATAPAPGSSLKQRILRASSWTVFAYGCTLVLRLASSLIMTRLLAPEAFGLIAIVATIGMVASLLCDIGIRQAIVHSPNGDDPAMLNTAWTMQILRGVLIWTLCSGVALALFAAQRAGWLSGGSVYASPELPAILSLGVLHIVLMGFETTKRFTADRRIDQKRVVLIELGAMFVGLVATVTLGMLMRSVWAIVIGGAIGTLCSVIAGHRLLPGHPNRLAWDPEHARKIFHYGKWILASSLLYVLAVNGDKLLLGVWVTPALLGCYAIGQTLAQVLEMALNRVFSQVASPAFGNVVSTAPQRLREVYLRMRLPFDMLFIGAAGFLYAVGPWLVGKMYDARYAEAGNILQLLSCMLIFARYGVSTAAYLALQAPRAQATLNLVRVLAFFLVVPLAHEYFGVQGAFWAIALHGLATVPVVWHYDRRFGLFSWRHEVLPLAVWPVGWAAGSVLVTLLPGLAR